MRSKRLLYIISTSAQTHIRSSPKPYFTTNTQLSSMFSAGLRRKNGQPQPTFQEMAVQRIAVLDKAVAAIDSRVGENPKKLRKRDQHLAEKAELERQLGEGQDGMPNSEADGNSLVIGDETSVDSTIPPNAWNPVKAKRQGPKRGKNQEDTDIKLGAQGEVLHQILDPWISKTSEKRSGNRVIIRDPIVPPSSGSGGIPEPSPAYLERASLPPQPASEPQHILLVLDLNGTILYRPDRRRPSHFLERKSTALFLDYILSRFQVMIWSSARLDNVRLMCDQLFPGYERQRLVTEWGREHMGLTKEDYVKRVQVYKRLEKVWVESKIQERHPLHATGAVWNASNTILIDDSLEKGRSEPFNLAELPEFTGIPEPVDVLRQLADYLDDVLMQKDVSAYMRQKPFKTPNNGPLVGK